MHLRSQGLVKAAYVAAVALPLFLIPYQAGWASSSRTARQIPGVEEISSSGQWEAAGLTKKGVLDEGIWEGVSRAFLFSTIENFPSRPSSPALRALMIKILGSPIDPGVIRNNPEISAGENLFTLRLDKLVEIGAFPEALELYAHVDRVPSDLRLLRSAIRAMLANGDFSTPCLEYRATTESLDLPKEPFWEDLSALCGPDSGARGKNRYPVRSSKDLEALSLPGLANLVRDGRIDYTGAESLSKSRPSLAMASILLNDPALPDSLRFDLLQNAVKTGARPPEDLGAFYEHMKTDISGDGFSTKKWKKLVYIYHRAFDARRNGERKAWIKEALALSDVWGEHVLLPFSGTILSLPPEGFSPGEIQEIVDVLALSSPDLAREWLQKSPNLPAVKRALEGLDNKEKSSDNPEISYEKEKSLTPGKNYVMHDSGLRDRLLEARNRRNPGEVVLLSVLALQKSRGEAVDTALIREGLEGLREVGLASDAQDLAIQSFSGEGAK